MGQSNSIETFVNDPTVNAIADTIVDAVANAYRPNVETLYVSSSSSDDLPKKLPKRVKVVYTLTLQDDKYYVGTTYDLDRRIVEHTTGRGSAWTKQHPYVSHTWKKQKSPSDEDAEVKRLMRIHGVDNVRGGSYSQIILQDWQIKALRAETNTVENRCFRCHRGGHYAGQCYAKTMINGTRIE